MRTDRAVEAGGPKGRRVSWPGHRPERPQSPARWAGGQGPGGSSPCAPAVPPLRGRSRAQGHLRRLCRRWATAQRPAEPEVLRPHRPGSLTRQTIVKRYLGVVTVVSRGRYACDFVRIKRYGDRYKVIYFSRPVRMPDAPFESGRRGEGVAGRADSNLVRARSRVQELALCNDWQWFVTLTLDAGRYDRYNLDGYRRDLAQWLRNQRRLTGCEVRYLLIPEQHKDGAWHMHGLLGGLPAERLRAFGPDEHIPYSILKELKKGVQVYDWPAYARKFGWVTATAVRDKDRVASYITKYVTKAMTAETEVRSGAHLYYSSRGLRESEVIWEGGMNGAAVKWDWQGEFCKLKWVDEDGLREVMRNVD